MSALLPPADQLLPALSNTLAVGGACALLSALLGSTLAWLVERTDLPGARRLGSLLSLPYAVPAYLLAMAWLVLGNPTVGLLREWLPEGGILGIGGITAVETSIAFVFPYLELRSALGQLDPSLEESARLSGAGPFEVARRVTLPLVWPSLLTGMTLSFLYAVSSFGVPAILGLPSRIQVFTTLIFLELRSGGLDAIPRALSLAVLLLAFTAALLACTRRLARRSRALRSGASVVRGKASRPSRVGLGSARIPAGIAAWSFAAIILGVPWAILAVSSLSPVAGRFSPEFWSLQSFERLFTLRDVQSALFNSLALAGGAAALATALAFGLGFAGVRARSRAASVAGDGLRWLQGFPGTVIALGLLIGSSALTSRIPVLEFARAPLLLIFVACTFKYAGLASPLLENAIRQVDPVLDEAARLAGATLSQRLRRIWLPLLRPAIGSAAFLVALPVLTELTMSVLLTGPGAGTLGTVLFELQDYADPATAAALAWTLLTATIASSLFLQRLRHED